MALAAACGDGATPGSSHTITPMLDAGPAGPFDITIASSPPIELPGTVLWLDANFGVARDGAEVRAWTDRSGLGHILEGEGVDDAGPTAGRLAGHGAIRFGGRARMALTMAIDERGREALTIGTQGFLIALVVQPEEGGPTPTPFALGAPAGEPPRLALQLAPELQLVWRDGAGASTLVTANATIDGSRPQMILVTRQGALLTLRVDGETLATQTALEAMDLPFLAPLVGEWELGQPGFAGLVGDVVMVAGPETEGATAPLEAYLRQKYGL